MLRISSCIRPCPNQGGKAAPVHRALQGEAAVHIEAVQEAGMEEAEVSSRCKLWEEFLRVQLDKWFSVCDW